MGSNSIELGIRGPRRGSASPATRFLRRRPGRRRAGLTLIELIVSLSILAMALLGFTRVVIAAMQALRTDREVTLARQAARQVLERMQGEEFAEIFALYNADPNDDPGGAATGPGNWVQVFGLPPRPGAPAGAVGEILFPTQLVGGVPQLREDVVDAALGMPRDLNGDGIIDGADRSGDYQILPVRVRFQWRGASGNSSFEFKTVLMDI